jgi:hypothetical protein
MGIWPPRRWFLAGACLSADDPAVSHVDVVLFEVGSVAAASPDRWWVPTSEDLAALVPGRAVFRVMAAKPEDDGGPSLASALSVWVALEQRAGSELDGTIVMSPARRDGYREGDTLHAQLRHVFDVAELDSEGRPQLNEARARFALGKRVLLGVTVLSAGGEVIERRQLSGRLKTAHPTDGLELSLDDGSSYWLPPDLRSFEEAPLGEYRLRSTGQVVLNPDYTCTWTVTRPPDAWKPSEPRGF